jgi:hypothetical protein
MFKFLFKNRKTRAGAAPQPDVPAPNQGVPSMSSEGIHVPYEKLSRHTLHMHYAMASVMEELQAVDWYRQRADDTEDEKLKAILLHNAGEEIEHASMLLEWIRRNDPRFNKELKEYLFTEGPITELESKAIGRK